MGSLDRVVTARVDDEVYKNLDIVSKEKGITRAEYVRDLLSRINPIKDGMTIYLLDYENVLVFNYDVIDSNSVLFAFIGNTQTAVSYELAVKAQEMGSRAKFIKIGSNTPNALDFHIAFYVGKLSEKYPNSLIRIISKDRGYDAMMKHAKTMNVSCERDACFDLEGGSKKYITDYADEAVDTLKDHCNSLPLSMESLVNFLQNSCFREKSKGFVSLVVQNLRETKVVTEKMGRLSYKF